MVAHMNAEALAKTIATGRGLVLQPLARRAVAEGRNLRPHPARRRDAHRLRPGCGLDQGRAGGRRLPHRPPLLFLSRGAARQRAARSRSNFATSACSIRSRSIEAKTDHRLTVAARASKRLARVRCGRSYHSAGDADDAGARIGGERVDDRLRVRQGFRRRREHLVDDRHLRRVDRHFAGKTVAAGGLAFAAKAVVVTEVDIDSVDRRHLGGGRAGKAQRSRQPIRVEKSPLRIAVGFGAELRGKVLGAPGQRGQPRARAGDRCRRRNKAAAVSVAMATILIWPSGRPLCASRTASLASA